MLRNQVNRKERSKNRVVQSHLDLNRWMADLPAVEDVRPGRCPCCDAPSRPSGEPLVIIGHGLRDRQQRGPLLPDVEPVEITIRIRRYRCKRCEAVIVVVPSGVLYRRLFTVVAIGWALALFALVGLPLAVVRERTSPWSKVGHTAFGRWTQLGRWVRATKEKKLFSQVRPWPEAWTPRKSAERIASTIAGYAPPGFKHEAIETQVFWGAMHAM